MSISQRLWDDDAFVPAGEQTPPPAMASQLLAQLHLLDASRQEQIDGVREWLMHNHASKSLTISLERRELI